MSVIAELVKARQAGASMGPHTKEKKRKGKKGQKNLVFLNWRVVTQVWCVSGEQQYQKEIVTQIRKQREGERIS